MSLQRRTPLRATTPLKRTTPLARTQAPAKRRPISPASESQRAKVRGAICIRCGESRTDPAHIIDRAMGGDDHPHAVVPLCRVCHRLYDTGHLSLLEYLEPHHRDELAYAVRLVGLVAALQRLTNERWAPERRAA